MNSAKPIGTLTEIGAAVPQHEREDIIFPDSAYLVKAVPNKKMTGEGAEKLDMLKWHEEFEIKLFLEGIAEVTCDSNVFLCDRDDIVVINPRERHSTVVAEGNPRYHLLQLDVSLLYGKISGLPDIKYIKPFSEGCVKFNNHIKNNPKLRGILQAIFDELTGRRDVFELMVKGLLFELVAVLFRDETASIISEERMADIRKYSVCLEPAFTKIYKGYSDTLSVYSLASLCGISEYYFCRIFKLVTGITATEYINELRINRAELMLRTTSMQISEISVLTGYTDISYFIRRFKAHKGMTPSESRTAGRAIQ